jgi:hypoxanthine-DNA glycosylase
MEKIHKKDILVKHEFDPVFDQNSKYLILGTIPYPKSREQGFYYGHPRNRFWKVMADVFGGSLPETIEEKKEFCYRNKIALWDVLAECEIDGASDSSIKHPIANDLSVVLNHAPIQQIFTTGTKAAQLYRRFCYPKTKMVAAELPSTSPANCRISYEKLKSEYQSKLYLE